MLKKRPDPVSFALSLLLYAGMLLALLLPDRAVSYSERRALSQYPAPSARTLWSGAWASGVERWLPDQFPFREPLRALAMRFRLHTLALSDYKGVYTAGGSAAQSLYPLHEENVLRTARRATEIAQTYYPTARTAAALIPDKSMLLPQSGRPVANFAAMERAFFAAFTGARIPLADLLTADDYYATDVHWRQERLHDVAARIAGAYGAPLEPTDDTSHVYAPFYGGYYARQTGLSPDALVYLTNDVIRAAAVTGPALSASPAPIYDASLLSGMDAYDVFLYGASPFLTVQNARPAISARDRTLVVFRDSFASSLAPLLLPAYETLVLVDLRYLAVSALPDLLPAGDCDVLFLFSAATVNAGAMLR